MRPVVDAGLQNETLFQKTKMNKAIMVMHACHPDTWEVEVGGFSGV